VTFFDSATANKQLLSRGTLRPFGFQPNASIFLENLTAEQHRNPQQNTEVVLVVRKMK